ncbi:hypothetical protein M8J76_011754 [Diaphorina citri]|nr:hypothetical protein M8J76_011754 [Diaphorina citri]
MFKALAIPQEYPLTPSSSNEALSRQDLLLRSLSHGLIQQGNALVEAMNVLSEKFPEVQGEFADFCKSHPGAYRMSRPAPRPPRPSLPAPVQHQTFRGFHPTPPPDGCQRDPPTPPPQEIWDVHLLVDWLRSNPPSPSNHFEVSRHVALLLLLASGRRVHDLTLLSLDPGHFQVLEGSIVLWPMPGSKTDTESHSQSGWKILFNLSEPLFDIASWIKVLSTLSNRRMGTKRCSSLFITTRGSIRPASRSIIAGWVKTALVAAGILASPGSVRSAVATFRYNADIPLDTILKQGNWRGQVNFFKYYYRSCQGTPRRPTPSLLSSFEAVT